MLYSEAGLLLVLASHGRLSFPGAFSERRVGLDHLAFAVADRTELEAWVARLEAHGVGHDGIVNGSTGASSRSATRTTSHWNSLHCNELTGDR